jgi:hypothetical protein
MDYGHYYYDYCIIIMMILTLYGYELLALDDCELVVFKTA